MFIGFANFYLRFIQDFNKIAVLLTSLLKIIWSLKLTSKGFKTNNNEVVDDDGSWANRMVVNLSKNKKSRKSMYIVKFGAMEEPNFLISNSKKNFNDLGLAFIEVLILQHFNLENHI